MQRFDHTTIPVIIFISFGTPFAAIMKIIQLFALSNKEKMSSVMAD
jgi:hypothetical protein